VLCPQLVECLRGDWRVLRDVGAFLCRSSEVPRNTKRISAVAVQVAKQPLPKLAPEVISRFSICMLGVCISSLSLMFAHGAASAQSAARPGSAISTPQSQVPKAGPEAAKSSQRYRDLSAAYFADCMKDWDAATHMTRQQWARTCRRVVEGRVQFMLQHEQ
jgi:hypothetical protein